MKKNNILYRLLKTKTGNLGSIKPVSRCFGVERGKPIDRYYIENFLKESQDLIQGTVLEVGDSRYTKLFGGNKVENSYVLSKTKGGKKSQVDFIADLETGEGVPNDLADCFILTQTLLCIFDVPAAVANALKVLKPGGVLLVTVPGITQISRYDYEKWGHYWSFTDQTLSKLFQRLVPEKNILIRTYGNVKTASAFLYGLSLKELSPEELDFMDPDYQMIIAGVIKKGDPS